MRATLLISFLLIAATASAQPAEHLLDNVDTDGDGFNNAEETLAGSDWLDPASTPHDRDADGLTNREEAQIGTDPDIFDTDGDSFGDGYEIEKGSDPTKFRCRPHDVDCDTLYDYWELHFWGDLSQGMFDDPDGDGLGNHFEFYGGCDPTIMDTDFDGLLDGQEYHSGLLCWAVDSDVDGFRDQVEIEANSDPRWERSTPTDRDGDGYTNDDEVAQGSDPDDYYSTPGDVDGDGVPFVVEQFVDLEFDGRVQGDGVLPQNIMGYCVVLYCELDSSVANLFSPGTGKAVSNPLSFRGASVNNPGNDTAILYVDVRDQNTIIYVGEVHDPTGELPIRAQEFHIPIEAPLGRNYVPYPLEARVFLPTSGASGVNSYDRDADGIRSLYGPYRSVKVNDDGSVERDVRTSVGPLGTPDPDDFDRCVPLPRFEGC